MTLGELVRSSRKQRGMTQEALAEAAQVSVRTLRLIESGRVSAPRPTTVALLAQALGLIGTERLAFQGAALGEGVRPARSRTTVPVALPAAVPPVPVAAVVVEGVAAASGPEGAVTVTLTITLTAPAVARFHLAPEPDPSASGAVPLVVDRTG